MIVLDTNVVSYIFSGDDKAAATAIMLNCPPATHDRDFSGIPGLEVVQAPKL